MCQYRLIDISTFCGLSQSSIFQYFFHTVVPFPIDLMSTEALSKALYKGNIKAVLLDAYVAAQSPSYFPKSKARVNKILKSTKAFGFVPGQAMTNDDALIKCFRNYVEQNKQAISVDVENSTKTLEVESHFFPI